MAPKKNTPKAKKSVVVLEGGEKTKQQPQDKGKEKLATGEKPKQQQGKEKSAAVDKPKQQQQQKGKPAAAVEKSKQRVLSADMGEESRKQALAIAAQALEKFDVEKDVARFVKSEFDKRGKGEAWNCVVGRHFGSAVSHEADNFIYFYSGQMAVLLFKS